MSDHLSLLKETYAEVLDATKHQDDKIGRLLTAIAFLTAASLALAGLDGARLIRAEFQLGDQTAQLGVLALSGYLIAVFTSVVLLVTSFATPLRLPGLRSTHTPHTDYVPWANSVAGSQIYFGEISRLSIEDWQKKWNASAEDLTEEKLRSLVLETHNLSTRTNFKYLRTSEAIACFSIAMLALALAVAAVALAATTGIPPTSSELMLVPESEEFRRTVGFIVSGYLFLQLFSRFRYDHQSIHEGYRIGRGKRNLVFFVSRLLFVILAPFLVWLSLYISPESGAPHKTMAAVTIIALLVLPVTLAWTPQDSYPFTWRTWTRVSLYFVSAAAATQLVTDALNSESYREQFVAGMALTIILLTLSVAQPTFDDFTKRVLPRSFAGTWVARPRDRLVERSSSRRKARWHAPTPQ